MLNNEKIVLMTKLALYEQGEGKKKIPVGKYFKSDYIGLKLLSSFIYINIAFFICVILWFVTKGGTFIQDIMNEMNITAGVVTLVGLYLATVVMYMLICYVYYNYKFKMIRRSLKDYNTQLKQLHRIQEDEIENMIDESEIEMEMEGEDKQ